MARVELRAVAKVFPGGIEAVRPLDLTVEDGELFVIVGPSGSGKSTLLRLIAGLEPLSAGSVWIDGRRVDERSPRDRDLAMAFQTPVVYPYLSVAENLAFGLRARGAERGEVERAVAEVAALLGLGGLLERRPQALSGGERQRVALGRALVRRPKVFLLDEPFSSLDAPLRAALRSELYELHRRLGTTMIHVTHDQAEALGLGMRIAVLRHGQIIQSGPPLEIYQRPASRFVAEFIGNPPMNILPCLIETDGEGLRLQVSGWPGAPVWRIAAGAIPQANGGGSALMGRVDLGIRAEHIRVLDRPAESVLAATGVIRRLELIGPGVLATLELGPHHLTVQLPSHTRTNIGAPVAVALDPAGIVWFNPDSGRAL